MHDSTEETIKHITRVAELIEVVTRRLELRGHHHDASKLKSPEKEAFDSLGDNLKGLTYGSPEYREQLRAIKPAIQHHYGNNSHHPEFYPNGIDGMSLLDLVEMFCDWKAAGERHADGGLEKSIRHNRERFMMSPQLTAIFENTRKELGW